MARAIPVLPLVGSMMMRSVPGYRSPFSSAASSIASATRSFTDPDGLAPSSLAHSRTPGLGLKPGSSINGVLPMARSMDVGIRTASSVMPFSLAACDRRQDRDDVTFLDRCFETLEVAHVLVIDIDIDEGPLLAGRQEKLASKTRVARIDVVDQLAQGRALGGKTAFAADCRAQHGRNADISQGL